MRLLDLMEPEETVGNLWHDMASGLLAAPPHPGAAVAFQDLRPSLAVLFRALHGTASVDLAETPPTNVAHRRGLHRRIGAEREREYIPTYDGERLRLPPVMAWFDTVALNRAAYFWLTALAALSDVDWAALPDMRRDPQGFDLAQIRLNAAARDRAYRQCHGLRTAYDAMAHQSVALRPKGRLPRQEAGIERAIITELNGDAADRPQQGEEARSYSSFAPVPVWLRFVPLLSGAAPAEESDASKAPPVAAMSNRKLGERRDLEQTERKDSIIIHRFESILSWVESLNLNRSVDDDDDENAQKAAEDQDNITLSKHDRRAATRLRLHLDLSPADAEHEKLAGTYTYPEWNHRARSYMDAHCRVLDAPAQPDPRSDFVPDARQLREVRRQFEALRPRRVLRPRQIDGAELDLDALIAARADLAATGRSSDRIYQSSRKIERDLAVAFLIDTSRSTEAALGETSVIDVARQALAALAGGIDAAGDQLGIWGFSSLRRDRVFLTRCKGFDQDMGQHVIDNIASLKPGHYTRLGAAVRHTAAMLAEQGAMRKLMIVLTDGKPNDLDHYEGQHGIEDSHMAVREARRAGLAVHGVILDEDGQDWFARIFGRGGFSLLPNPTRLTRALPDIYRKLTQES